MKVITAAEQHGRDEIRRDYIDEPLNRSAAALRLAHHADDLREQRVAADTFGAHDESAGSVDSRADQPVARFFLDRDWLAGDHRFVNRAGPLLYDAIDRNFLARPHAQSITGDDAIERDILLAAVGPDDARGLRRQSEQRFDRAARIASSSKLEDLAEQHQRRDRGGRLEIDRYRTVGGTERIGK